MFVSILLSSLLHVKKPGHHRVENTVPPVGSALSRLWIKKNSKRVIMEEMTRTPVSAWRFDGGILNCSGVQTRGATTSRSERRTQD